MAVLTVEAMEVSRSSFCAQSWAKPATRLEVPDRCDGFGLVGLMGRNCSGVAVPARFTGGRRLEQWPACGLPESSIDPIRL